jgi:hypothetical protein
LEREGGAPAHPDEPVKALLAVIVGAGIWGT